MQSGKAVLEAAIAATEVMCKVGLVAPGKFHARGFHPTALCSTFGAAAAAGKLYGLDWPNGAMPSACAAVKARDHRVSGGRHLDKRLHPGWSAHGGVIATLLA